MNDLNQRYLVSGSSALKPDCSRHSNENEHIIDFPARVITTYDLPKRPSVKNRVTAAQRVKRTANNTTMARDLKQGSLKGTPFGPTPVSSLVAAGAIYTIIGLAALFIAV